MIEKDNKTGESTKEIIYEEAIELVHAKVNHILMKAPILIRKYTNHLVSDKGKFIRARSLIICAEDKSGKIHSNAIILAAALELLHLATLVHDDVIDNAELRRGNITLQKKYGKKTAVICGDYLLCEALKLTASIKDKQDYLTVSFPDYMSKVCLGELAQHTNNGNLDLSMYQYFKIISGKTAALFDAAFFAGAYFSGSDEKELNRYRKLGFILGIIFQLTDDCIDFEITEEAAMKPVQSDYEQGVITLPLIHAFREISDLKNKAIHSELSRSEINDAVTKSGGLIFTRRLVQRYDTKARHLIHSLDITDSKKEKLILILNQAARVI